MRLTLTHVHVQMQKPVAAVNEDGDPILAKAGTVPFDVTPEVTIDEFRDQLVSYFNITPRKKVTIRWWGKELEDGHDFRHYRVSDGSTLEVTLRTYTVTELRVVAEGRVLERIRIQSLRGKTVVVNDATRRTTPRQIKQELVEHKMIPGLVKSNVEGAKLCFSHLMPLLGPSGKMPELPDDEPIGPDVIDNDIFIIKFNPIEPPDKKKR